MTEHRWLKSYDPRVPHHLEYPDLDIHALVRQKADQIPDKAALKFMGLTLTYGRLFEQVDRLATALAKRGIKSGDRVVLLMPNCPQFVISFYALMRLGATAVLANPLNVERELVFKFQDSGAKALIVLDLLSQRVNNIKKQVPLELIVYTSLADFLPFPLNLLYPIKRGLDKAMPKVMIERDAATVMLKDLLKERAAPPAVKIDPREMAVLIYSGGTTGVSKGIMLSHQALVANATQVCAWGNLNGQDSLLAVLPLFHGFGMSVCMNGPLSHGGTIILLPRFNAQEVCRVINKERPTIFAGVPTMFIAIKELPDIDKYDLKSLRGIFVGAAPLPLAVMEEFSQRTGAALIEGYGLTEAVTAVACNPFLGTRKPGTIGIPFPDVEWKIVDLADGVTEVPIGQAGEIILRGPDLMMGYLNLPDKTAETLKGGWLFTGDIGVMDEDGYITLVDRKKDLVIIGGFNVFPSEVDEVLHQHPQVAEAVAVGLPHPRKGEYLKAYLVPKAGQRIDPQEVIAFCQKNLTPYMVPREVEVRAELPKSMIGKVLRRSLREEEEAKWRQKA
ncbi:MAG: long-chain fatty acid--CoA ligase [Desulfarculus sp.]|nr:long-chain fatty acid--CoA ligase [Desulfarculus sp.]